MTTYSQTTESSIKIDALILAGGKSSRMGTDKALIQYHSEPQLLTLVNICEELKRFGQLEDILISCSKEQIDCFKEVLGEKKNGVVLSLDEHRVGPLYAILKELHKVNKSEKHYLMVIGIDLPLLGGAEISEFIASCKEKLHTLSLDFLAAKSPMDSNPEPMLSLWRYQFDSKRKTNFLNSLLVEERGFCPRQFLLQGGVETIELLNPRVLANVNFPSEMRIISESLQKKQKTNSKLRTFCVLFFAILREQAGQSRIALESFSSTPLELYEELSIQFSFTLPHSNLRVAVNNKFSDWSHPLQEHDSVTFIPPVAGG